MASRSLWSLLLVSLIFPVVFCRYDYFHYYYSKYHKGISTKEASLPSGISTKEAISSFVPEEDSPEENVTSEDRNRTRLLSGEYLNKGVHTSPTKIEQVQYIIILQIGVIVGSIILFVFVLSCIICCCPSCCNRRKGRKGYVIGNRIAEQAARIQPHQPAISQIPQPLVVHQHLPMNNPQFPPQYQELPPPPQYLLEEPQSPYRPMVPQFYYPSEAPPPYEDFPNRY